MGRSISIGVIGDYNPEKISHPAINAAIQHAAKQLAVEAIINWLPTHSFLDGKERPDLTKFDCLWASAGSPYRSMEGMIKAIQIARELNKPFIGT